MQLVLGPNALIIIKLKVSSSLNPKHCVMCLCNKALTPFPVVFLDILIDFLTKFNEQERNIKYI